MNRQRWKKYGFMAEVIVLTLTAALCWKDVSQGAFAAGHGAEQAENNSSSESGEDSGTGSGGNSGTDSGEDSGTVSGGNSGADSGEDSGTGSGVNSGTDGAEDSGTGSGGNSGADSTGKDYIKWVDFHVTSEAMRQACAYDVDTYGQEGHLNWVDLLAYLGARYGGDFKQYKAKDMDKIAERLQKGETTVEKLSAEIKSFDYYREAYGAVLDGLVGEYQIEAEDQGQGAQGQESQGEVSWTKKYGLKGYSPIAKSFPYNDYDDFGVARSYGYRREHLGHDMMGQTGTPIRTKYRMTLKNNVKPIIAADALLHSLFYQLILFLITHRFKVFKEATDVIIDYVFCLFF